MKWKMECWWKDLSEDLSPRCFQIVMLRTAHVVDQLHLACKPLITLLAPVPEIMNDDILTLVHLQMVWGKERKTFFLPQTKIEANKILKPYPCFLSHSNFSTFFRVTTSMSSTTWNIFTKRLFSRLWFHFQALHFSTTLPFLFSFPWIEHTQRKCNWHHMSLEEKLSIFDPWGKNDDNFRRSQIRSARKNLLRIGTWSCWLVAVLLMLV